MIDTKIIHVILCHDEFCRKYPGVSLFTRWNPTKIGGKNGVCLWYDKLIKNSCVSFVEPMGHSWPLIVE